MKTCSTSFTVLIAVLCLFSSVRTSWANNPEDESASKPLTAFSYKAYMSTTNPNHLKVIVQKNEDLPVSLALYNDTQTVVYKTKLAQNAVLKPLDLTGLEPGNYYLELKRGSQIEKQLVVVE